MTSKARKNTARQTARIEGYDLTRAAAIIGMVFVNFRVVLDLFGADVDAEGAGGWLAGWITGRAAATFVVLAGVGIALLTRRAAEDRAERPGARRRLICRALFLAAIGWPFLIVWEGDILHYYAAFFLVGAVTFHWQPRHHLIAAAALALLFIVVTPFWKTNWDFSSLTYNNLWTWNGQLMNLFINGFHPLVPWLAFLFIGMALGRHIQRKPEDVMKIGFIGLAIAVVMELICSMLEYGTSSMPPMPQYIAAASGIAVALICFCRRLGERLAGSPVLRPFVCLGQLSLTIYIVHVFAGVFPLAVSAMEDPGRWNLGSCVAATAAFCAVAAIGAATWRHWFSQGPAEWLMRRFSDHRDRRSWLVLACAAAVMGLLVAGTHDGDPATQSLPDENDFTQRCTRWVVANFLFKDYDAWTREHFGSKKAFEDEWLTRLYFEYAREEPMDDTAFYEWVTARVEAHITAQKRK